MKQEKTYYSVLLTVARTSAAYGYLGFGYLC
jgi:hypothetical protein